MYVAAPVPDILKIEDFGWPMKKGSGRRRLSKNAEAVPGRPHV
jgi:hypothetical protein